MYNRINIKKNDSRPFSSLYLSAKETDASSSLPKDIGSYSITIILCPPPPHTFAYFLCLSCSHEYTCMYIDLFYVNDWCVLGWLWVVCDMINIWLLCSSIQIIRCIIHHDCMCAQKTRRGRDVRLRHGEGKWWGSSYRVASSPTFNGHICVFFLFVFV